MFVRVIVCFSLLVGHAVSHGILANPEARLGNARNSASAVKKYTPYPLLGADLAKTCGTEDPGPGDVKKSYMVGDSITFTWNLPLKHPAEDKKEAVRLAIKYTEDGAFADNILYWAIFSGSSEDPASKTATATSTLTTACEKCTLQWIWESENDGGGGGYIDCADISIAAAGTGTGAAAGTGTGAAAGTGTGDAGVCTIEDLSPTGKGKECVEQVSLCIGGSEKDYCACVKEQKACNDAICTNKDIPFTVCKAAATLASYCGVGTCKKCDVASYCGVGGDSSDKTPAPDGETSGAVAGALVSVVASVGPFLAFLAGAL